jgi:hypothetical protein
MAAKIVTVSRHGETPLIWDPGPLERLWFFPDGSEYLRYSAHFHAVHRGGFRQNLPLCHMFVVVLEGKLSVKNYWGTTFSKIEVRDQIWFTRGTERPCPRVYRTMFPTYQAIRS